MWLSMNSHVLGSVWRVFTEGLQASFDPFLGDTSKTFVLVLFTLRLLFVFAH